jgi:hypothetical protein
VNIKFNVRALINALDPEKAARKLDKVVRKWAYNEGLEIMAMSQPLVPVDAGALKSTGIVELPVEEDGLVIVRLGYGGVAGAPFNKEVGYAVHVHENLTARHKHGQAKYLEQPYLQRKPQALANLETALQGVV